MTLDGNKKNRFPKFFHHQEDAMQQDNTITRNQESMLIQKIRSLAPDKIAEVLDFVDFLRQKDQGRQILQAANKLAEDAFKEVWDNSEDEVYGSL